MEVTVKVKRYNPEVEDPFSYWADYSVEAQPFTTVLDTLIQIREDIDGSLALRCSCRSAICGSCAMRRQRPSRPGLQDQGLGICRPRDKT